jgi:hypothetical protein
LLETVGVDKDKDREDLVNIIKEETNNNPPIPQRKTLELGLPI